MNSKARDPETAVLQAGWSFIELVTAVAIVGAALLVMFQQMTISYRETEYSLDRVFAYQKALQMLAEIESSIDRKITGDVVSLEMFDDQNQPNPVLTTLLNSGAAVPPDHPSSGNSHRQGEWMWSRTVSIDPIPSNEQMRFVKIRIERRLGTRMVTAASIGSLVNLSVEAYPSVQVHDLYAIAIAEAPGIGPRIEAMRTSLNSAVSRLHVSCPGLDFRVRWITKFGYGRDPTYAPYVNTAADNTAAAPAVYWYPSGSVPAERLYHPDLLSGRVRVDGGFDGDYEALTNQVPHAIADQFNHCTREPQARRLFAQRNEFTLEKPDEPPLQLLLEDMAAAPQRYRNAIFVNLHGDALPLSLIHI